MTSPRLKSLRSPDDIFQADGIEERSVQVSEQTIGRAVVQPGWRWSEHVRPIVGTLSCMVRHIGLVLSGRLHVAMDDGRHIEVGPDDVFDIPPGHDAWVVGDEPWVTVEVAGIYGFGRPESSGGQFLTTVMVTDIVDSTATAERIGDAAWRSLLDEHLGQARRELDRYRGVEVATTGDGLLATFDGAARAVRCASAIRRRAREIGLDIRAGIHTGEVEAIPGNVRGIAVHVAARVLSMAGPGDVLVSATTRDVVAASDITFEDRGAHELKGLSGARQLFAATVTA